MQVTTETDMLPFEYSVLSQASNMLPRASERYVQFLERDAGKIIFSPTSQKDGPIDTRHITLSCLDLDLGGPSGVTIFKRLHEQTDIRTLTICADHITIGVPLHLPGTDISIWARKLSPSPDDMNLPNWRLHPLKGHLQNHWAVWMDKNWWMTFTFDGNNAVLVDYQDYH